MAVVVEQTIPFSSVALDLANPHRWNKLFPLIRPSVHTTQTAKGQTILVDTALSASEFVSIAAVGNLANFSSKLLDERQVTAIVTEQVGAGILTAVDIKNAIENTTQTQHHGLVVARAGTERRITTHGADILEVEVNGEVELDHILHLLGSASKSCRTSIHHIAELMKTFVKSACTVHSKFHTEKADGNPAVLHVDGPKGFEKAKEAVERDLARVLKRQTSEEGDVVYSVHYSDVNGMSRLEHYIVAKEIADALDTQDAQKLPYRLSHSTILDHTELARGWAISICPVSSNYLSAQSKPKPHQTATHIHKPTSNTNLSTSSTSITFSDPEVRRRMTNGCKALITAEPTITEYDTIVGDGDCGYTLRDGAKQVLDFIKDKDLAALPDAVGALIADLEVNMGGTSGALYCIYLTALAHSLASEATVAKALKAALEQLQKFTRARLGDRTMMDALIPFVETFEASGSVEDAVKEARDGVEGTKKMEAKLGRSTYLDESATRGVPDPGAYGLLVLFEAMSRP